MALDLPYTALITPAELGRDALASLSLDVSVDGSGDPVTEGDWDAVVQAIVDTTSLIEEHLQREIIVRNQTLRFQACHWKQRPGYLNAGGDVLWSAFARQWPLVQVTSVDLEVTWAGEVTLQQATASSQLVSYDPDSELIDDHPFAVVGFAGYRRADQAIDALNAATDPDDGVSTPLADLTVLPPLVPAGLRRVCTRLVLHELFQAENKQLGTGMSKQQIGSGAMAIVETVDKGFMDRELQKLLPYRYVH